MTVKMVVGLGNIGQQFDNTRHNLGFSVIDNLAKQLQVPFHTSKFNALIAVIKFKDDKVLLVKPTTLMNNSGLAVRQLSSYYHILPNNIMVIQDDLALPVGKLRLRKKGSAGGHNGIKSLINNLHTDQFNRLKVGIGFPKNNIINFVLGKFPLNQEHAIIVAKDLSVKILLEWLDNKTLDKLANKYN